MHKEIWQIEMNDQLLWQIAHLICIIWEDLCWNSAYWKLHFKYRSTLPFCFLLCLLYPTGKPTFVFVFCCFFHPPSSSLVRRISLVLKWFDPSYLGRRSRVTMVPAFLEKAMKCVNAAPVRGVSIFWADSVFITACCSFFLSKTLKYRQTFKLEFNFVIFIVLKERRGSLQTQRETARMWRNKGPCGPKVPTEREISSSSQREGSLSYKADNTRNTLRYL